MSDVSGINGAGRTELAKIIRQSGATITVPEAAAVLHLPRLQTAQRMARWAKQGWLTRVRRGLYLPVPLQARAAEDVVEDPWVIAARLFEPCYISGWSAAEHWGLTEQIFRTVVVITTRSISQRKLKIQSTEFWVKRVIARRMFGTKTVWRGKTPVRVADPAKTLVDMLDDPAIAGGARAMEDALKAYLASTSKDTERLLDYAKRMRNGAVLKRLGYLLERADRSDRVLLDNMRSHLTWGNAKLDPALPSERLITRWRLWVAAVGKEQTAHD